MLYVVILIWPPFSTPYLLYILHLTHQTTIKVSNKIFPSSPQIHDNKHHQCCNTFLHFCTFCNQTSAHRNFFSTYLMPKVEVPTSCLYQWGEKTQSLGLGGQKDPPIIAAWFCLTDIKCYMWWFLFPYPITGIYHLTFNSLAPGRCSCNLNPLAPGRFQFNLGRWFSSQHWFR